MVTGSILLWQQLGVMWGWCQRNMPFYGHARGRVSRPRILGEPPAPPVAGSISAAAPSACCGTPCSHNEAAAMEATAASVGPFPSASHPSLSTQVGYLGAGSPGAGRCRWWALTKVPLLPVLISPSMVASCCSAATPKKSNLRAFALAVPGTLPLDFKRAHSLTLFRSLLNYHLFHR